MDESASNGSRDVSSEPPSKKQKLDDVDFDDENQDCKMSKNHLPATLDCLENNINKNQNGIQYLNSPLKSQDDCKEYRTLKLRNGLTVLLISHSKLDFSEEATKHKCSNFSNNSVNELSNEKAKENESKDLMAFGSLCINVGSFSDPHHVQGLSHLLEHAITMGSKKYPKENEYHAFIHQRWGSWNACTEYENTMFSFKVPEKYLEETLDRFANFFIDPSLTKDSVSRECHSIENEFKLTQQLDDMRRFQLLFSLKKKDHPASTFSCGNNTTLLQNIDIEELHLVLHEFRKRHYSAHRMTLVIQASLSLDILEDLTNQNFSNIPVNYLPPEDFSQYVGADAFISSKMNRIYHIKTVQDVLEIELNWIMPPMCHLYKSKPWFYISDFLYRIEEGSLFHYLGKKMWASRKDKDSFFFTSTYSIFSLRLNLTDEGSIHQNEVLKSIFSYLNFIQRECTDQIIFNKFLEYTQECCNFSSDIKNPTLDSVESIALNMQYYPPSHYLNGYELVFEYDPDTVKNFINILKPDNVNIMISRKQMADHMQCEKELVYQTEYSSQEIPDEWIDSWKIAEPLPEFDFDFKKMKDLDEKINAELKNKTEDPLKINNDKNIDLWYKRNVTGVSSKFSMSLHLNNSSLFESPARLATVNIIVLIFDVAFKNHSVGISSIAFTSKGFLVNIPEATKTCSLGQLTQMLLDVILCDKLMSEELFELAKSEILRRYYNIFINPKSLIREVWLALTLSEYWMVHERYNALIDMTYSQFIDNIRNGPKKFFVECLLEGNMKDEDIIECVYQVVEPLLANSDPPETHSLKILKFMNGEKCCQIKNFSPSDAITIVTNIYQTDVVSVKLLVICKLLMVIFNEPLFHCLRTQEQLGYHVEFSHSYLESIIFLEVTVFTQADKFTGEYVNERIQNFINNYSIVLKNMTNEEFDLLKENYIKFSNKNSVPGGETLFYGIDTLGESLEDICDKEMKALENITIDQVYSSFVNYMVEGSGYKKLSLQIVGTSDSSSTKNANNSKDGKYHFLYSPEIQENENLRSDYYINDINMYKRYLNTY